MTRLTLSFAASLEHKPEHPERTAKRSNAGLDVTFQTWPNRASMAKSIRMQERRAPHMGDWRPVVKLSDGEGY